MIKDFPDRNNCNEKMWSSIHGKSSSNLSVFIIDLLKKEFHKKQRKSRKMGCQKGKEELQDFMGSRDGIMTQTSQVQNAREALQNLNL